MSGLLVLIHLGSSILLLSEVFFFFFTKENSLQLSENVNEIASRTSSTICTEQLTQECG